MSINVPSACQQLQLMFTGLLEVATGSEHVPKDAGAETRYLAPLAQHTRARWPSKGTPKVNRPQPMDG